MVFAALLASGVQVFGTVIHLQVAERYVLLASAFLLLVFVLAAYVKRPDFITLLAFFGLLYISADLLMSFGLCFKGVLLNQPVLSLFLVGPVVGMALKGGKEHP